MTRDPYGAQESDLLGGTLRRIRSALNATLRLLRSAASRSEDGLRSIRRRLGPRGTRVVALGVFGLAGLGLGLTWGTWSHVCHDCPSIAQIYAFEPKEASQVFAADGSLLAELAVERRTAVPYTSLPPHLPAAFVAVEDRRFWSHPGVDFLRTFRVGIEFLVRGYDVAGASTITQQLAGNMFSGAVDRRVITVHRKLKEMRVAFALERAYTKREILQAYMNQINFGDGHYGVLSAAEYYFKKDVRELNLPESALLAALPRAPQRYSPIDHPDRALQRRNLVLDLMAGQDMITDAEAEEAKAQPLGLRSEGRERTRAPYFVEWVRRELMDRYGPRIYESGYRIYTTLDPELQAVADSALQAQLRWVEGQPEFDAPTYDETRAWSAERMEGTRMEYVQGAFIALDPVTGDVLALIGGRDFEDSEFNRATQALRQPGSVFKPFVYTAAVASGIPPSQVFVDAPVEILLSDSTIYSPKNFGDRWWGPVTARQALYNSINVVAVKVGQEVGEEAIGQYARQMGIGTDIPRVPSVAIGAASVKPLEIAEAYSTFANVGIRAEPRPILRVEDADGQVLWESDVEREEVLDERSAWIMVSMLRDVVDRGTGVAVRNRGVASDIPVAGKTGTTNDATDAWFVGFTPEIVTTTWVGFDNPARLHRNAQGGRDAAPVNAEVLKAFYRNRPAPVPWRRPEGIAEQRVDRTTGLRATEWCPADSVYVEYFVPGTEPRSCDVHGPLSDGMVPDEMPPDTAGSPRPRP